MRDVSSEGFCANNLPGSSNNPIKRKVRKRPPHVVRYSPPKYLRHSRLTEAGNQHIPLPVCGRHRWYRSWTQKWCRLDRNLHSRGTIGTSTFVSFEEEGRVGAPKTEGIREGIANGHSARLVWHVEWPFAMPSRIPSVLGAPTR